MHRQRLVPFRLMKWIQHQKYKKISLLPNLLFHSENAITPFQPDPPLDDTPNFDLMKLIEEVQNEANSDDECVMAATQCEQNIQEKSTSTTTKAIMKKYTNPQVPTFANCKFGVIQNLNIHVHKN